MRTTYSLLIFAVLIVLAKIMHDSTLESDWVRCKFCGHWYRRERFFKTHTRKRCVQRRVAQMLRDPSYKTDPKKLTKLFWDGDFQKRFDKHPMEEDR